MVDAFLEPKPSRYKISGCKLKHEISHSKSLTCLYILQLRIDNAYEWNQRESSPKGTSLVELVTFGINRIKYACRVIDVLCDELKAASTAGKCNTLVALPGFNMYSNYQTSIKDDTRKKVDSTRISVVQSFNKMVKYDWCNSAIVLIADQLSAQLDVSIAKSIKSKKKN